MKKFLKRFQVTTKITNRLSTKNNPIYDDINCYAYLYEKYVYKHWYFPFGKKVKKIYVTFDIPYSSDTYKKPYPYDEWVYDEYLGKRNYELKHNGEDIIKEQIIEYCKENNINYFE